MVRTPEGTLQVGRTLPGRGAWLCAGSLECLRAAARRKALARALRAQLSADEVLALAPDLDQ